MNGFDKITAFSAVPGSSFRDVSSMAEPELSEWAERTTVDAHPRSSLINVGAIAFWMVVACLLFARVLLVDVTTFHHEASNEPAAVSMLKMSSASRAAISN